MERGHVLRRRDHPRAPHRHVRAPFTACPTPHFADASGKTWQVPSRTQGLLVKVSAHAIVPRLDNRGGQPYADPRFPPPLLVSSPSSRRFFSADTFAYEWRKVTGGTPGYDVNTLPTSRTLPASSEPTTFQLYALNTGRRIAEYRGVLLNTPVGPSHALLHLWCEFPPRAALFSSEPCFFFSPRRTHQVRQRAPPPRIPPGPHAQPMDGPLCTLDNVSHEPYKMVINLHVMLSSCYQRPCIPIVSFALLACTGPP